MKTHFGLAAGALFSVCQAQEISIQNLRAPFFDSAGKMIRRLTADSETGPLDRPRLKEGTVEFFSSDKASEKFATFHFDEATYQRQAEIVEGDGHASLRSVKGDLSGDGFRYELTAGRLQLNAHVVGLLGTVRIEGKQGEAYFSQLAPGKEWIMAKARLDGGVVVTGINPEKYKFDRAESFSGTYTESDGLLRLASPVTYWRGEEKVVVDAETIKIDLAKKQSAP